MKKQNYYNEDGELCEASVRKNIVLAELGEPLTIPLSILNENCDFKKKWDEIQTKWHGKPADGRKAYRQRPEVKARMKAYKKAYDKRPEVKERRKTYMKVYHQKPEVKARMKDYSTAYYQRPEVKDKGKAYRKEYYQRPEVKARRKIYLKAYCQRIKLEKQNG